MTMSTIISYLRQWCIHLLECITKRENHGYLVVFINTDRYEYPSMELHVCDSHLQASTILSKELNVLKDEHALQEWEEIDDWFGTVDEHGNLTTGEILDIDTLTHRKD